MKPHDTSVPNGVPPPEPAGPTEDRPKVSAATVAIVAVVIAATAAAIVIVVRRDPTGRSGRRLQEPFVYDAPKLVVRPDQIMGAEIARFDTRFAEPRGLSIGPDGRVYVVGDRAVRVFDGSGKLLDEHNVPGEPRCLAVATDGSLYLGLTDRVVVLDGGGKLAAEWTKIENGNITSIAVAADDVFVADVRHLIVLRYDRSGRLLGRIGGKDAERHVEGLLSPGGYLDVAVGPDGLLWVANPGRLRVEAYDFAGRCETIWGRAAEAGELEGFSGCCNPSHIAILPDGPWGPGGRFVTSEKGAEPIVKVYSRQGVLEGVVAAPEAFPKVTAGMDLAAGTDGRIYVLDPSVKAVRVFAPKGGWDGPEVESP